MVGWHARERGTHTGGHDDGGAAGGGGIEGSAEGDAVEGLELDVLFG